MFNPNIHLTDQHKRLTRQLWCLVYARESFQKAKEAAEQFSSLTRPDAEKMQYTFVSSGVLSYSMPFVGNKTLGVLPGSYSAFKDTKHEKIHEAILHARNTIYAHIDSTQNNHHFQILVQRHPEGLEYSYRPYVMKLEPIVFPDLVELCDLQLKRTLEGVRKLMPLVVPLDTAGHYLDENGLTQTEVTILWPT